MPRIGRSERYYMTMRVRKDIDDFLNTLENKSQFVIQLIRSCPEFIEWQKKQENDERQPRLFDEDEEVDCCQTCDE